MFRNTLAGCVLLVAAWTLGGYEAEAQTTATSTKTPTPTPSVGSSPSPSPSAAPKPFGVIRELAVLDCNGGLHILPNHPFEVNVNLRGARHILNQIAREIQSHAECVARPSGKGWCPDLTQNDILTHFIPSMPMLLNYISPLREKQFLPDECMSHYSDDDGKPAFAQTFWDTSAMTTLFANLFGFTKLPQFLTMPDSCNYDSYMAGRGCKFTFNEPISYTNLHVGIDTCADSFVPYISIACDGPWCDDIMRPCIDKQGSSDCGSTGLKCRKAQSESDTSKQLIGWLSDLRLIKDEAELSSCFDDATPSLTGNKYLVKKLREKLYTMFNQSFPVNPTGPVTDDLHFCLPSDDDWSDIKNRLQRNVDEYYETSLNDDPITGPPISACALTRGCDLLKVGDGTCNLECFNSDCKYDGGDCGGAPTSTYSAANVDKTLDPAITVSGAEADADTNTRPFKNIWEVCNGVADATYLKGMRCVSCGQCGTPVMPYVGTATQPGNKCENCRYKKPCEAPANCRYSSRHLTGIQDRIEPWDGDMYDGSSVFDFDRKTGINFTTPAASFDTASTLYPNMRTVFQVTCAGEIGITAANGFLQLGIAAPWLADVTSFLGGFVDDLVTCRIRNSQYNAWNGIGYNAGTKSGLSQAMVESRFMAHHPGFWFYQFFYLITNNGGVDAAGWGIGNTLWQRSGANTDRSFGPWSFVDPLLNKGLRREPDPSAYPSPITSNLAWLQATDWAKQFRMFPPADGSTGADCDWDSVTDFTPDTSRINPAGQPYTTYNRRCKLSYNKFGDLFNIKPATAATHRLHFDMRMDKVCEYAVSGARDPRVKASASAVPWVSPFPKPTLDASAAQHGLPVMTLVYEGQGVPMAAAPYPCKATGPVGDAECSARFGLGSYCTDLDEDLLDLKNYFSGRNVDPLGRFIYGMYNVDRQTDQCSSAAAMDTGLRQFLNSIAGRPRDKGTKALFCFMRPDILANNWREWQNKAFDKGTCDQTREYGDPNRVCLVANQVAPSPPLRPSALPASRIARLSGFGAIGADYYVPKEKSGVMPFVPNIRNAGTFGAAGDVANFMVSIPVMTRAAFTNTMKEKIRWVLGMSFAKYGFGIAPDCITINGVEDNPYAFQPMPDGSRAGVTISFTLDIPDRSMTNNITVQLQSSAPGTLGGQAGSVFATLGVVPFKAQREVAFRRLFPPPRVVDDSLSGGEIFAIVAFVFLILGCGAYFAMGGTVSKLKAKIPGLGGKPGKSGKGGSKGVGDPVTPPADGGAKSGTVLSAAPAAAPDRKTSRVDTLNPLMSAEMDAATEAATKANAGTQPAVVVNVLRTATAASTAAKPAVAMSAPAPAGSAAATVAAASAAALPPALQAAKLAAEAKVAAQAAPAQPTVSPFQALAQAVQHPAPGTSAAGPSPMSVAAQMTQPGASAAAPVVAASTAGPTAFAPTSVMMQQQPGGVQSMPSSTHSSLTSPAGGYMMMGGNSSAGGMPMASAVPAEGSVTGVGFVDPNLQQQQSQAPPAI